MSLQNGLRPLAHRFNNGEYYEPNCSSQGAFSGAFALDNIIGGFYDDLAQAGALVLSEGANSVLGGCDQVKITADGNTITVPGAWRNLGSTAISTTVGAVNVITVIKAKSEIQYAVTVA